MKKTQILFVGAGAMVEAILSGIHLQNPELLEQIYVINRSNQERLAYLEKTYGVHTTNEPHLKKEWVQKCSVMILASKPQDGLTAISEISPALTSEHVFVSLLAGVTVETFASLLPCPIVRVMPNTSSQIGHGTTAVCFSKNISPSQKEWALSFFRQVGEVHELDEELIDGFTGIAGCSPAYIYLFIDSMIKAGVNAGLSEQLSRELTLNTIYGATKMVEITKKDPEQLQRNVTSKDGATEAGLRVLQENRVSDALQRAIKEAISRATELKLMERI